MTSTDASSLTRREWWRVEKNALLSRTVEIEIEKRKLEAEQYETYAEIHRRGLKAVSGHSSLSGLIQEDLLLSKKRRTPAPNASSPCIPHRPSPVTYPRLRH